LAIFFLFQSKKFLPKSFKFQLLETSPQKQKDQIQKQLDLSFFLMSFPFLYILNSLQFSLAFTFCQVCLLVKETAEIETGMAEKSSVDHAGKGMAKTRFGLEKKKVFLLMKK
jgi:hypothetical protein